jgi:hypothetical protein
MKKACLALAVLLPLLSAARAEEKKAETKGPHIVVEPSSFDFGKAVQNQTLAKEFSIRNYGDAELVIEKVSTTCGCTAAIPAENKVKPGGSTPLRVTLETRSYSGRVQRTVVVRSNDPASELTEVKVEVTVVPAEK